MKTLSCFVGALMALLLLSPALQAADKPTKDDLLTLVKSIVSRFNEAGPETTLAEITAKKYSSPDLYPFVNNFDGVLVAHGANPGLVGEELMEARDPTGKQYVKEMLDLVSSKGEGWVSYYFSNPATKKVEIKDAYVVKVGNYMLGVGIYR